MDVQYIQCIQYIQYIMYFKQCLDFQSVNGNMIVSVQEQ